MAQDGQPRDVVLLVDDHSDTVAMYAEVLRAEGFDVFSAADGVSAAFEARAHPPSIVISDIRMPGDATAADVCRYFVPQGVPVVVLTAVPPGREHDQVREEGCALIVRKPFRPTELVSVIRNLLEPELASPRRPGQDPS